MNFPLPVPNPTDLFPDATKMMATTDHFVDVSKMVRSKSENDALVAALIDLLIALPNIAHLCFDWEWDIDRLAFAPTLTEFGERLRLGIESRNRRLLHYMYQEALADHLATLGAIHS